MAAQKKKSAKKVIPKKEVKKESSPEVLVEEPKPADIVESKDVLQSESSSSKLTQNIGEDALPIVEEKIENTEENTQEEVSQEKDEPIIDDTLSDEGGKGSLVKKIIIWSGVAIVVGALLGISWKLAYERGVVVGQQQVKEIQQKEAALQEKIATPTPEEISKIKYTIEVLNGSGISGEAARVKGILEKEGFTVSSTGNADKSDLEETTISAKSSVEKEWIDLLKTALGTSVVVSESTSLDDTESADVIVTVGSKKAE